MGALLWPFDLRQLESKAEARLSALASATFRGDVG